jgi:hypothetical protein
MIARSTLWGTVQLGDGFYALSEREQNAVLAHEHGHLHHRHAWKRLGWIVTLRAFRKPEAFFALCEAQELEADRYAVERGHAPGLISFLFRHSLHVKSDGYPTTRQRLEAIHVR